MLERDARWAWLFPATYAIHIAEEYAADFPEWLAAVAGARLTQHDFLVINAVAFVVMLAGVTAAVVGRVRWPLVALATIVTVNAALHIGGTILTSYSPGAVSATLFWLPLGLYGLRRLRAEVAFTRYIAGIAAGLAAHALVSAIAIFG